jgi:hypothetical protein
MATFYEEIRNKVAKSEQELRKYEAECMQLSGEIVTTVRKQLGWPDQSFTLMKIDTYPEGVRHLPRGWVDKEGRYNFVVHVDYGPGFNDYTWKVYREKGAWFLGYSGTHDPLAVVDATVAGSSLQVLADHLMKDIRTDVSDSIHEKRWA